jgi:microcystin-dependent protein
MAEPFIGEIRMFGGNFAPAGWAFCDGSQLAISENSALFTLIGTTYGGDGQTTFNLPDLRGRLPVHQGTNPHTGGSFIIGEASGVETVTLTVQQLPVHTHAFIGTTNQAGTTNPPTNVVGQNPGSNVYIEDQATVALAPDSLLADGGSQPHDNFQPYLCISFIIALFGVFPTQS